MSPELALFWSHTWSALTVGMLAGLFAGGRIWRAQVGYRKYRPEHGLLAAAQQRAEIDWNREERERRTRELYELACAAEFCKHRE